MSLCIGVSARSSSASCYAEYRFDPERAAIDRSTVFLYGPGWRLVLKRMDDKPAFKVVGAASVDNLNVSINVLAR